MHAQRTGLIAFDDHIALKLLSAANKLKIDIPNRLQIIGINNDYMAKDSYPGISSWDIPYQHQAQMAINKLLHKFGHKAETGEEREIEVPLTFIERGTTKYSKRSDSNMWKQAIEDALQKTKVNIERFGDHFLMSARMMCII